MLFNTNINGDPRSFMYYKGDYYINGTELTLTDAYIKSKKYEGKKIWKYARFSHKINKNGSIMYFFTPTKIDWVSLYLMGLDYTAQYDYAPYFIISPLELSYAIEDFIKPIKLSKEETEQIQNNLMNTVMYPKRDWDYPELRLLWILYIATLIGSLIFTEFYIVWGLASFIFYQIRKGILK